MPIKYKSEYYRLYNQGHFGNRPKTWDSVEEVHQGKWKGNVSIRDFRGTRRGDANAPLPLFDVPLNKLEKVVGELAKKGVEKKHLRFNQAMPDQHLTIQGEVMRDFRGIYLLYSTIKGPMNLSLRKQTLHARGLKALEILKGKLWESSYSDIMSLLDTYSNGSAKTSSVIEFSAYDILVGDTKGRNAVIWEVRDY